MGSFLHSVPSTRKWDMGDRMVPVYQRGSRVQLQAYKGLEVGQGQQPVTWNLVASIAQRAPQPLVST